MSTQQTAVSVDGLTKRFTGSSGIVERILGRGDREEILAVDGITFDVAEGEIIGLVGESGCGKSTTVEMISGLLSPTEGQISYYGTDVRSMDKSERKAFKRECQMVFQDPYEALNPRFNVFDYIAEPLRVHGDHSPEEIEAKVYEVLEIMGMTPGEYSPKYPHELSGGEKQRVHLASALVFDPNVLLCDEPVSMLDVSIRASILDEIQKLNTEFGMTVIFISHDITVIDYLCERVFVMYAGEIVEHGQTSEIVDHPKHPYTQTLISAIPSVDPDVERERVTMQEIDEDNILSNEDKGNFCKFANRCPESMEVCHERRPDLTERQGVDRPVACHLYDPTE